jgi:DoxX-like family
MNVLLWGLQILLALHTAVGAVWKFSNSEQAVPSLNAIPHGVWLAMSGIEILCSIALLLPALNNRLAIMAPIAAACIAAEMLFFCAVQIHSGNPEHSHMLYWLIVAAICALIVCGRLARKPV